MLTPPPREQGLPDQFAKELARRKMPRRGQLLQRSRDMPLAPVTLGHDRAFIHWLLLILISPGSTKIKLGHRLEPAWGRIPETGKFAR
jgi:hypothetical protein